MFENPSVMVLQNDSSKPRKNSFDISFILRPSKTYGVPYWISKRSAIVVACVKSAKHPNRFERLMFNTKKLLEGIDQNNLILCLIFEGHYSMP